MAACRRSVDQRTPRVQVLGFRDWNAPWAMGANLTLGYKGFTLYVAGSGNFGGQGFMDNDYMKAYGDRKYSEIARNRWTPETAKTATYPRLTSLDNGMNFNGSDFWIYDTDVFYLNTVQLTYTLPSPSPPSIWKLTSEAHPSAATTTSA